ncbi:MAG: amino acid permease, partial [Mesorhizobium sp.]
ALPYGWIGVIAAFQFGIWYYLGIEGTTQAAEEVRSPARSLPYGTMAGMITLLIAAAMTWYVCASMMPWE